MSYFAKINVQDVMMKTVKSFMCYGAFDCRTIDPNRFRAFGFQVDLETKLESDTGARLRKRFFYIIHNEGTHLSIWFAEAEDMTQSIYGIKPESWTHTAACISSDLSMRACFRDLRDAVSNLKKHVIARNSQQALRGRNVPVYATLGGDGLVEHLLITKGTPKRTKSADTTILRNVVRFAPASSQAAA